MIFDTYFNMRPIVNPICGLTGEREGERERRDGRKGESEECIVPWNCVYRVPIQIVAD